MGTWNIGAFENDAAGDWLTELVHQGDKAINGVFNAILANEFLESDTSQEAIAAAEIVAAATDSKQRYLPADATSWLKKTQFRPAPALIKKGHRVVQRILDDSELKDSWSGADLSKWTHRTVELRDRLASAAGLPSASKPQPKSGKRITVEEGDILAIPIGSWAYGIGKVFLVTKKFFKGAMLIGVYDLTQEDLKCPDKLPAKPRIMIWAKTRMVRLDAQTTSAVRRPPNDSRKKPINWIRIGHQPLTKDDQPHRHFVMGSSICGDLYRGERRLREATEAECERLPVYMEDGEIEAHTNCEEFFYPHQWWVPKRSRPLPIDRAKALTYSTRHYHVSPKSWNLLEWAHRKHTNSPLSNKNPEWRRFKALGREGDEIRHFLYEKNKLRVGGYLLARNDKLVAHFPNFVSALRFSK